MKRTYNLQSSLNEQTHNGGMLPLSQYQDWFDVIITNNVDRAQSILQTSTQQQQHRLINNTFEYDKSQSVGVYQHSVKRQSVPFHLAVCYSAKDMAKLMLDHGVDVVAVNKEGDNVLHSCVVTSFTRPDLEDNVCDMVDWLHNNLTHHQWQTLLFQENSEQFYPLEFAVQQGCLTLFQRLLSCKGHVTFEGTCGLQQYRLHDVTEYEVGERHSKSPVSMLAFLDKDILNILWRSSHIHSFLAGLMPKLNLTGCS